MTLLNQLAKESYISLATFRKTGEKVLTPVWVVGINDKLYVFTSPASGKIKRIKHTPKIEIAPCTGSGKITGEIHSMTARIVGANEQTLMQQIEAALNQKYRWQRYPLSVLNAVVRLILRRPKVQPSYIEIAN